MASPLPAYEHYLSVKTLRLKRLLIFSTIGIGLVLVGYTLVPTGAFLTMTSNDVSFFRHTFGHFLWGAGVWILLVEVIKFGMARKNPGAWHILLTKERFSWKAPRQPYGREASFDLEISDIQGCECRYISENRQSRSYWICPVNRTPIRLKDTSGVNIPKIFEHLEELGVPYREVET